jgi:hypothetical protein
MAGTPLHVRLDQPLDTRRNQPGDRFTATLTQPVRVRNEIVIPGGTQFQGRVMAADASGRLTGRAHLALMLDSFRRGGREYRISTRTVEQVSGSHKGRNTALIGGGAVLGGALGAIFGGGKGAALGAVAGGGAGTAGAAATGKKEVSLPAETALTFSLSSPLRM